MNHTRHAGIFVVPVFFNVGIVGAGGLGSPTALAFAKMGVSNFSLWDDDRVSEVNIPTQLHKVSDIGNFKIQGLAQTINEFAGDDVFFDLRTERFTAQTVIRERFDLFVSAVDSIDARKGIWESVRHSHRCSWYLDMRMSAQQFQYFLVDMNDQKAVGNYWGLLDDLNEADIAEAPCTMKATFFCAMMAAGHAGTVLRNVLRNEARSMRLVHYIPQNQLMTFNL